MQRFLVLSVLVLMSSIALADDARQLRLKAAALVYSAENARSVRERQALLEEAHGKLLEIQTRYPSESVEIHLFLDGKRVSLSPGVVFAKARLAGLHIGNLRDVLGRELSPTVADENGWTDLHYAAALNLSELVKELLAAGASVDARLRDDGAPLSDSLKQSLEALELRSDFSRRGYMPLHMAEFHNALEAAAELLATRGRELAASEKETTAETEKAEEGNILGTSSSALAKEAELAKQKEKLNYIGRVKVYEFKAKRIDTDFSGNKVAGVRFAIQNQGKRTLNGVKVTVYFEDANGNIIFEKTFHPVRTRSWSNNAPLKPNYIWRMGQNEYYTIEELGREWKEGAATVQVTDIELAPDRIEKNPVAPLIRHHEPQYDEITLKAQKQLKSLGLYDGTLDGILGPKTRIALRLFQQKHSLPLTEELDHVTRRALEKLRPQY